jgi:hypothetical protein
MGYELRGAEIRLERAHEHIDALKHESRMFQMELPQPYGWAIPDKPIDGEYIMRAQINRVPPMRLGILAADSAHNLRAVLDMIAWELALKGPKPPTDDDRSTGFPICTDDDAWESRTTQRMIERIDPDAVKVIYSFQPYNRPPPPRLALIQFIDNWSKHKAIPGLLGFYVGRIVPVTSFEMTQVHFRAFEDGDEIGRARRIEPVTNPEENFKAQLLCHVSFSKSGPGHGYPIDFLERTYIEIRDEILPAFERFFEY